MTFEMVVFVNTELYPTFVRFDQNYFLFNFKYICMPQTIFSLFFDKSVRPWRICGDFLSEDVTPQEKNLMQIC